MVTILMGCTGWGGLAARQCVGCLGHDQFGDLYLYVSPKPHVLIGGAFGMCLHIGYVNVC